MATEINNKAWRYIENSFNNGKLSHSYIFCGSNDTGKLDLLKKFFKLVNNEKFSLSNQNIILIESEIKKKEGGERRKDVSVEQIREGIKRASYLASTGKKKFFIIKNADNLSRGASNSLLKTVEEPHNDTIVVLFCEKEESLISTIRSRCQKIFFNLMPSEEIKKYLERKFPQIDKEKINLASTYSRGRYKLAERILLNDNILNQKKEVFEIFKKTVKSNWLEAIMATEKISKNRDEILIIIDEWVWSLEEFLNEIIKKKPDKKMEQKILLMMKDLLNVKERIRSSNANEKIQLENFFIKTI